MTERPTAEIDAASICNVTLVRDADGAEVAWEGHAGGNGTAARTFAFYVDLWQQRGLLVDSDPETLTARRRWGNGHTAACQWTSVTPPEVTP